MKRYLNVIRQSPLFSGINESDLDGLLSCLSSRMKSYSRDGFVLHTGDRADYVGLVLAGSVTILREDIRGNRNILARCEPGELFGEVFACVGAEHSPVSVIADTPAEVLFINFKRIVTSCSQSCAFHAKLVENMLRLMAQKNLALNEKVNCIGHRTTREKVEAFLMYQQERAGTNPFTIPFSRSEMADYLCVDRSALSQVLGKMQEEGMVRFQKNKFELVDGVLDKL